MNDCELHASEESDILPSELKHMMQEYEALIETVEKEEPFANGIDDFKDQSILNYQFLQDVTMVLPSPQWAMPSTEEFPGPYKIAIHINSDESEENNWMFSYGLNKLFTRMLI